MPSRFATLGFLVPCVIMLVFSLSAPAAARAQRRDTTRAADTVKDLHLTDAQRQSYRASK